MARLCFVIILSGFSASSSELQSINDYLSASVLTSSSSQESTKIMTLMCTSESCADASSENDTPGCQQYITPLNTCYNAKTLFPYDESWSDFDIYDEIVMNNLKRTFYQSRDGTCAGRENLDQLNGNDDSFTLPFDTCVGPFGPPRPWGKFTLVDDVVDESGEVGENDVVISTMKQR